MIKRTDNIHAGLEKLAAPADIRWFNYMARKMPELVATPSKKRFLMNLTAAKFEKSRAAFAARLKAHEVGRREVAPYKKIYHKVVGPEKAPKDVKGVDLMRWYTQRGDRKKRAQGYLDLADDVIAKGKRYRRAADFFQKKYTSGLSIKRPKNWGKESPWMRGDRPEFDPRGKYPVSQGKSPKDPSALHEGKLEAGKFKPWLHITDGPYIGGTKTPLLYKTFPGKNVGKEHGSNLAKIVQSYKGEPWPGWARSGPTIDYPFESLGRPWYGGYSTKLKK